LPGLNGFVGEFLILQGTFLTNHFYAVLGASAVIFAAVYMLWMYQRVFVGEIGGENSLLKDLNPRELLTIVPLIIMAIWMGVGSKGFISLMEPSIQKIVDRIDDARQDQIYRVENQIPLWTSDVD
jgi:NADH-quinone oxidoreductase subunit M